MSDDDEIRLTLRLPAALRDQLKQASDVSNRSLNSEIVHRLALSLAVGEVDVKPLSDVLNKPQVLEREAFVKALDGSSKEALQITVATLLTALTNSKGIAGK